MNVYNVLGQEVKELSKGNQAAGYKTVFWDGRDKKGRVLSAGIYFCRIQVGAYEQSAKIILLR
jgi:flagellar hook assembly protein FlgD